MEKIVCKVCGGQLAMRVREQDLECQNCGVIYPCEIFAAQSTPSMSSAVCRETATAISEYPAPTTDPYLPPMQQKDDALANWHTNYGASCAGVLISVGIGALVITGIMGIIVNCIYYLVAVVYAFFVYPKYFSEKPPSISSGEISFFNMLLGGLIFGCIWNANLTKRRRGCSNIVCGILSVAACSSFLISAVMLLCVDPYENIDVDSGAGQGLIYNAANHNGRGWWFGRYPADKYDRARVDECAMQVLMDMGLSSAEASRIVSQSFEDDESGSISQFWLPINFQEYTFAYSYDNAGNDGGPPKYVIQVWND